MSRRRALIAAQEPSGRIPNAYQEVDWIKSSNNSSYIATGVIPTTLPKVVTTVLPIYDTSSRQEFVGFAADSVPYFSLQNYQGKSSNMTFKFGTSNLEFSNSAFKSSSPTWINITVSDKLIINGTTVKTVSTYDYSQNTQQIRLFKGPGYGSKYSLKETMIYDGNELKQQLIPCYRKADSKIGMYDLVTDAFFAGSGTFTKGADV